MNSTHKKTKIAFTLVELLAVVAIIGVLVAITMGIYGSVKRKGVESRIKTELATIELALENYKAKNHNYPHSHPWSWDKPNGYMYPPNNWTNVFPITNHLGGNQLYKYLVADAGKIPHLPNVKESQYEGESLLAPVTDVRSGSSAKWYYNSFDPRYNKNSYDLWVEYGEEPGTPDDPADDTVRIISNWNK